MAEGSGSTTRFARVAIVGLPNAGKSTLLNTLVGEKLAATSQTPQTTRGRILGVVHRGSVQLAFLDTPGIHQPEHALNRRMLEHVALALEEADLVAWIVDADGFLGPGERAVAKRLKVLGRPVFLLLNKIDLLSKGRLLEKVAAYQGLMAFEAIIPVGARTGLNLEELWSVLENAAPAGDWAFGGEDFTDQTERSLAAEFIREKVLRKTREEVPHGVAVRISRWLEAGQADAGDAARIEAEILVEKAGHRKIVLGQGGAMIRDIRLSAQRELRKLLQRPVRLELFVRVEEGWRDRPDKLDQLQL